MSVREISAEEFTRWNRYVESHVAATPYHLAGWCTAVQAAYRHEPVFLVSETDGGIDGVLPLVFMRSPLGGSRICSLPFCDVGGCLADNDAIETKLIRSAIEMSRRTSAALHVRTRSSDGATEVESDVGKVSMLLNLPGSSEALSKGFTSKLRSQIRKAQKNGLVFQISNSRDQLDSFYTVFSKNMRDLGSPVHSRGWFESVRSQLTDSLTIGVVRLEDQPVAAGIVMTAGKSAAIPWASALAEYNRLAPNMLLYWGLLKHCSDSGSSQFDFGRSTYGEGTYRFKKQWGARPVALAWRDFDHTGKSIQNDVLSSRSRALAAGVWRKLPLPVANVIGPRLRKHISL